MTRRVGGLGAAVMLGALLASTAHVGSSPGRMDGGPLSPEDRAKRDAERLSRREFKTARAADKRARKAAKRAAAKTAGGGQ